VIVSTYPGVTAVLGELRRRGQLDVPCYSSITDLAGLYFWAHPGIDLHFVTHPESIEEVERIAGPGSVRWAKPPTAPSFLAVRSRQEARRALALPADAKVIAISGGGWGVGDLLGATQAALEVEDAIVLCLCGRNDKLRARIAKKLRGAERLRLMGFTDRMGDVLAASDALIHSSAGLTVLEAIIRGCPVVSYGFGYGHVRVSNTALKRFGLAQVAGAYDELQPELERALARHPQPDGSFARRPSTASLILTDERRARTLPRWRLRTARAATATATATAVALWGLSAGASYSLVSRLIHMRPMTAVETSLPEVGVLVDAPTTQVGPLANQLAAQGIHVSFALSHPPPENQLGFLRLGDQCLPRLPGGGLVRWIGTSSELHRWSEQLGGLHHFLYASSAPDIGQWWLAHGAGGRLIGGAVKLDDLGDGPAQLRRGEVVELSAGSLQQLLPLLARLERELRAQHLRAVSVGRLIHDSGSQV
jgi:UDP-N-acetylglucosamine:LPS N-acetylglucosamine transferase